jgi:hypothetical protein
MLIFNGTDLITVSDRKGTCSVQPCRGDPLKAMPFTEFTIDDNATYGGATVFDGVEVDKWQAHRPGNSVVRQPAASMHWYLGRAGVTERALLLTTADIAVQVSLCRNGCLPSSV